MNPYEVLIKPMITEKSTNQRHELSKVSFYVSLKATKIDVKNAVKAIFGVDVAKVNTCLIPGKVKRRGLHLYRSGKYKKAILTLKPNQSIPIFED